jgi:hypothetical protein
MCPPPWFNKSLKKDVITLLWDHKIDFDPEKEGFSQESQSWNKKSSIHLPRRINKKGEGLGLGLFDWDAHCAAISVSWLLKYRDATDAPWKRVLDLWFANTILDRGAPFSFLSKRELTAYLNPRKADQGEPSKLSLFWKTAIGTLKNDLTLAPILKSTTRQGLKAFPFGTTPSPIYHMSSPNTKPHGNTSKLIS